MSETNGGARITPNGETRGRHWWTRFVCYVKRATKERKSKKKQENSADRAAKKTADATVWIAAFTIILAIVSSLQWWELQSSSAQTDRMIRLYRQQVGQLSRQSGAPMTWLFQLGSKPTPLKPKLITQLNLQLPLVIK